MQSDQVLFAMTPIACDIHMGMGILGTKAMQHEIFHREFYSDESIFTDNNRLLFYPPPSPPPTMPPVEGASAVGQGRAKPARFTAGQLPESSSGHSQANSASEEAEEQPNRNHNHNLVVDERKQRRMLSNRESARRSRMRKQKHLDELRAQVAHMRAENRQLLSRFEIISRSYIQILEENRVLKSQTLDLSQQVQQLRQAVAASQSAASVAAAFKLLGCHTSNINNTIEIDPPHPDILL